MAPHTGVEATGVWGTSGRRQGRASGETQAGSLWQARDIGIRRDRTDSPDISVSGHPCISAIDIPGRLVEVNADSETEAFEEQVHQEHEEVRWFGHMRARVHAGGGSAHIANVNDDGVVPVAADFRNSPGAINEIPQFMDR